MVELDKIIEVRRTQEIEKVNKLLSEGWKILLIHEWTYELGRTE